MCLCVCVGVCLCGRVCVHARAYLCLPVSVSPEANYIYVTAVIGSLVGVALELWHACCIIETNLIRVG